MVLETLEKQQEMPVAKSSSFHMALLIALVPLFAACSKGGQLSLEAGAKRLTPSSVGPLVQVNQGGKALVVEQGKTADTGVHGWVTIQAVQSRSISSASGGGLTGTTNKASSIKK